MVRVPLRLSPGDDRALRLRVHEGRLQVLTTTVPLGVEQWQEVGDDDLTIDIDVSSWPPPMVLPVQTESWKSGDFVTPIGTNEGNFAPATDVENPAGL